MTTIEDDTERLLLNNLGGNGEGLDAIGGGLASYLEDTNDLPEGVKQEDMKSAFALFDPDESGSISCDVRN